MSQALTITPQEAFAILKQITNKTTKPIVNFDGTLVMEVGERNKEYTLIVEGSWVLDSGKKQFWKQDFLALRDEQKIQDFIGVSQIIGVDLGDKRFSFVLANGVEINIIDCNQKTKHYFTLSPHVVSEDKILSLNADFTYTLTPLVDSILR